MTSSSSYVAMPLSSAHRAHLSYEFLNVPHIIMRPVLLPKMFGPARRYSVEFPLPSVAGRYSSTGFAPQIGQGQRKPTNVKQNNLFISPSASLVSPSAFMTLIFISSLCYMSVDEWRRRKSRGFPIQQEHQGLNRDEQVKDAQLWCRDNTNCWGNLRLCFPCKANHWKNKEGSPAGAKFATLGTSCHLCSQSQSLGAYPAKSRKLNPSEPEISSVPENIRSRTDGVWSFAMSRSEAALLWGQISFDQLRSASISFPEDPMAMVCCHNYCDTAIISIIL